MSLKNGKPETSSKQDHYFNLIANVLKNFELRDPILDECKDLDKLRQFFLNGDTIPFSGFTNDSSDTLLNFMINLSKLSPTLSSCIDAIGFYAFSGKIDFVEDSDFEFEISNSTNDLLLTDDLDNTSKINFKNQLKKIDKKGLSWNKLSRALYESYKATGNAYMAITITKVLDQYYPVYEFINPIEARYAIPRTNISEKRIKVSPLWTPEFIQKNKPREFPVYPHYDEDANSIKTIIHIKNGYNRFYGRPDWWGCYLQCFNEVKNWEYLLKTVHNNFMGLVAIEMESESDNSFIDDADAQKQGYKDSIDRFEQHFTNKGANPTSAFLIERPPGASPMTVVQFPINTSDKFYKNIGEMSQDIIIMNNMWSRKLLGVDSTGSWSNLLFESELKTKLPLLTDYQNLIDNEMLNAANDFTSGITKEFYNQYRLKHKSPFDFILTANVKQAVAEQQVTEAINSPEKQ